LTYLTEHLKQMTPEQRRAWRAELEKKVKICRMAIQTRERIISQIAEIPEEE